MKSEQHGAPTITVTVYAPSSTDPKQFTWAKVMKVGDAAEEAARAWGLTAEAPTFQNKADEVFDRQKPLVACGVRDGDTLELVSAGGGV
jgi:hypothetical protein